MSAFYFLFFACDYSSLHILITYVCHVPYMEKVPHVCDANKPVEPSLPDVIQPLTVCCACPVLLLWSNNSGTEQKKKRKKKGKIKLTFFCPAVESFLFLSPNPSAELISHPPIIVDLVPLMQYCRSYLMMYHLSNCCSCSLLPNCNSGPGLLGAFTGRVCTHGCC